jgi:predicted TIM-barrel fold metal-dependent hydrolase
MARTPLPVCLDPDPDTRAPKVAFPAGACDAHYHVFGPVDEFPPDPVRRYDPCRAPVEDLRRMHAVLGIERGVVVQASCYGTDNSALLDAIASSGGAYRGTAVFDPEISDGEIAALDAGGVRGGRFHFGWNMGRAVEPAAIAAAARRFPANWHVELLLEPETLLEDGAALLAIPVPLVIDHQAKIDPARGLDQPALELLCAWLKNENVWVKVSGADRVSNDGAPYRDVPAQARAIIAANPDRVVWGTDWPHPGHSTMPRDGELADTLIEYVEGDSGLLQKILVDNPAKAFFAD